MENQRISTLLKLVANPERRAILFLLLDSEHSVPEAVIRRLLGKLEIPSYDEAHEVEYCVAE